MTQTNQTAKNDNEQAISNVIDNDVRQRFFIQDSPVRGDIVRLSRSYATTIAQKPYPEAIKRLLGEMLTAASLLISTVKIDGRLSVQLQSSDSDNLLNWAMAECDHNGIIRALASWKADTVEQAQAWQSMHSANEAFAELGATGQGVLFINIQPETGEPYQGIVERSHEIGSTAARRDTYRADGSDGAWLARGRRHCYGVFLYIQQQQGADATCTAAGGGPLCHHAPYW